MVKDKVLNIIKEVTHKFPKKLSFTLDTLDVDSLDLVDILMRLESEFNIEFTDAECDELRYWSINKLISNIETKIND
jgi:acyl carrier protein